MKKPHIIFTNAEDLSDYLCNQIDEGKFGHAGLISNRINLDEIDWFAPRDNAVKYLKAQKILVWKNNSTLRLFTHSDSDRLRGINFDCLIIDEPDKIPLTTYETAIRGLRLNPAKLLELQQ